MKVLRKQWQISGVKMKVKVMKFLDIILSSFGYIAMYICGGLIASSGTENFKDWCVASIIVFAFFLVMFLVWIGLFLSMRPKESLEKDGVDLKSIIPSITEENDLVDYRITGDSFKVELRCPRPYFESVKPLLEEFAEEMLDAECVDSDEEV